MSRTGAPRASDVGPSASSLLWNSLVAHSRSLLPSQQCQSGSDPSMSRNPFAPFRVSAFQNFSFSAFRGWSRQANRLKRVRVHPCNALHTFLTQLSAP